MFANHSGWLSVESIDLQFNHACWYGRMVFLEINASSLFMKFDGFEINMVTYVNVLTNKFEPLLQHNSLVVLLPGNLV